jgi:uncharacterized protein (TIGR02246 family)
MCGSKKIPVLACVAVFYCSTAMMVRAQVGAEHQGDAADIRAAAKRYFEAKLRGDVQAMRSMWTPDGDYVDATGQMLKAQDLIRQQAATPLPVSASSEIEMPKTSLRFITSDVAIEDGSSHFATEDGSELTGRFTAVWAKRDGRWLLDSLREATIESPALNEHLRPLEWLLGEWVGTRDDAVILISSHWSEGGKYLVREFLVRGDGHEAVSGTQRIGWDPITRQIKSWTFDSQGGSSEGIWRPDGERWLVDSTDVLADGKKSKTSTAYVPGDDGRFTLEAKSTWDAKDAPPAAMNLPTLRVEFQRAPESEVEPPPM